MTYRLFVQLSFLALALPACAGPCTGPAPGPADGVPAAIAPDDDLRLWTRGGKVKIKRNGVEPVFRVL